MVVLLSIFIFILYNSLIFFNLTATGDYPQQICFFIFESIIMGTQCTVFVCFQKNITDKLKKAFFNKIQASTDKFRKQAPNITAFPKTEKAVNNLNIVHLITRITISEELIHYLFIMRIVMSAELNHIYYILFSDAFQLAKQTNL